MIPQTPICKRCELETDQILKPLCEDCDWEVQTGEVKLLFVSPASERVARLMGWWAPSLSRRN